MSEVEKAFDEFKKVQEDFCNLGACDSEPDAVMQLYLFRLLRVRSDAKEAILPRTAKEWELYSGPTGVDSRVDTAALRLTEALILLGEKLKPLWLNHSEEIVEYLWRIE